MRHHSVVRSILEGNWTYESAGLLDQTHLRFFTRREIEKLFFRAGFAIEEMRSVIVPDDRDGPRERKWQRPDRAAVRGRAVTARGGGVLSYQFLVRARPAPVPELGLTSIVIVTHNQIDYTRQCLDSIARLTDEPYELIVVDNASTDGTVDYLRAKPGVRLIVNHTNRGFPAAVNQGIAAASGKQILLLNNDVIVTTGWLFRLLRARYGDPAIGIVGPCSNCVSGPQQVQTHYDSLGDLDGFAWDWGGTHEGQCLDFHRLVGFCLLIKREVIETIGLLDEQFGIGCFEDDDYCLRPSGRDSARSSRWTPSFTISGGGHSSAAGLIPARFCARTASVSGRSGSATPWAAHPKPPNPRNFRPAQNHSRTCRSAPAPRAG